MAFYTFTKHFIIVLFPLTAAALAGCSPGIDSPGSGQSEAERADISIMAAASLTDALEELKLTYEEQENVELIINYGSSGQLRQQISQGAPADIFLSADISDMELLEQDESVSESIDLLQNQLTLVASPSAAEELHAWEDITREALQGVSIGEPDTVPAGRYARQSLENLNLWEEVEANLIYGSDVRQVLTYVETGNVDAGIVYQTDALTSEQINIIDHAPEDSHDPITYPFGLLNEADGEAQDFYYWLQEDESLDVFESYGFARALP